MPRHHDKSPARRSIHADRSGDDWRLFVAIAVPPAVIARVAAIEARLEPYDLPVRWVNPANAHLTLHFLGETPAEQVELIRLSLRRVTAGQTPFDLATGELGTFPERDDPRVLWLGVTGEIASLQALHRSLGQALRAIRFTIESRGPTPHVTLGRLRDGVSASQSRGIRPALRSAEVAQLMTEPLPIPVTGVALVRSHLERSGPRYETVETYPLGKGKPHGS